MYLKESAKKWVSGFSLGKVSNIMVLDEKVKPKRFLSLGFEPIFLEFQININNLDELQFGFDKFFQAC